MKYCKKCDNTKPHTEFNKRADGPGYRAHCKKCSSKDSVKRRQMKCGGPRVLLTPEEKKLRNKQCYKRLNAKPERKAKQAFYEASRRAIKLQAQPNWLTDYQKDGIKLNYVVAKQLSALMNVKLEVDHIVPLKGKLVCGLHVPWNLQIMVKIANQQKSNKYVQV